MQTGRLRTFQRRAFCSASGGLSLLAQGNQRRQTKIFNFGGPIPARAGEPLRGRMTMHNPGPIPARAGEPRGQLSADGLVRAYPCSRRGTSGVVGDVVIGLGLSLLAQGTRGLFGARGREMAQLRR